MIWIGVFIGLSIGGFAAWFFWWNGRRELLHLDEEKQRLQDERIIVAEFMHDLVETIGRGLDRHSLFQRIVHTGITSVGGMSACVFERQGTRLRGVAIEGLFPPHRPLPEGTGNKINTRAKFLESILKSESFEVGEGVVGGVAQTRKGVLIADARSDSRIVKHKDPVLEIRTAIVVPISFRDNLIAVLAIVNSSDGMPFAESDLSMALSLAEQAGLAIQNLDLMALQIERNRIENDLSLASNIQGMLLPKQFPESEELGFAAVYRPAQKVGGDFYDAFPLEDGRIGVAIADVSGKGIPASLVMAICQTHLRHFAMHCGSPADALRRLNKVIDAETRKEMFVTVVYAVVDTRGETITMARAGHELPIICRCKTGPGASGSPFVRSAGMAIGMVPPEIFDLAIEEVTVPFRKGDVLMLYTDGITEATNSAGEEFTNHRLALAVANHRERRATGINEAVLASVSEFASTEEYADDITLLTVKHL